MPDVTRNLKVRPKLDGEAEFNQALKELNSGMSVLKSEMNKLNAEYQGNTDSVEYLTKQSDLLNRELLQQHDKVEKLREIVSQAAKQFGESDEQTQKWVKQLNNAEAEEFKLQHQLEETNKKLDNQGKEMVGLGDTVDQLADKFGIHLPDGVSKALNGVEGFSAGTVAAMAAAAAAVVAVVEAFKKLQQITIEVAASVDETLSQSLITGIDAETLQVWDYAAELIDVDVGTITGAMTKLEKSMDSARDGNTAMQESFAQLGISVTDAHGQLRDADDVFMEVVDALGAIENGTERDTKSMELLGKSAKELTPLFLAGSEALEGFSKEAEEAGYVLDEYQLERLAEVDDSYQRMQKTIEGFKRQLAADFAPAAKAAMDLFSDVVKKAGEFLERSGLIENLANIFTILVDIVRTVGEFISNLPGIGTGLDVLKKALEGVSYVLATIADAARVAVGLIQMLTGSFGNGWNNIKTGLGFNMSSGQLSNTQRLMYGNSGNYYNEATGMWQGNYGMNATGNDNWRGGLTWVGEAGPELAYLPQGTQIMNAQDSRSMGGDTFYITIDAKSVKEFNDIVEMAQSARVRQRMR